MNIKLKKFQTNWHATGHVAFFDVQLDCGVDLFNLSLLRPEHFPDVGWLVIPQLAREDRASAYISAPLRKAIGDRACQIYEAMTGTALKFQLPPNMQAAGERPRVVKSEWVPGFAKVEADDAGLRRVLGDAERDSLDMAGI